MKEVILNDKCVHCNDKECHDGEHFCNQAMKENSFYKNAELYRGLEVIKRPTYAELENRKLERRAKEWLVKDKGGSIIQSLVNLIKEFTEPREKKIAELEAQIEKMKCCGNCKYSNQDGVYTIVCKVGGVDKTDYIEIDDNQVCDKWKLREIKEK